MTTTEPLAISDLYLLAAGHSAFQLLWAGLELGVFRLLAEQPGLTRDAVAAALGLEAKPARVLMTGLSALRLVVKEGGGYRNATVVDDVLVEGGLRDLRAVLGWQAHIVYPGLVDFVDSLRENRNVGLRNFAGDEPTLYQRLARRPELERVFQDAMSSLSQSANRVLAEHLDLRGTKHLVDAGGGDATNAIALARANPGLAITVFDTESVCARARANIAQADVGARLRVHEGDLFTTPFPREADAVLFAHMMTIWSLEKDTTLLRRAHEALPRGGKVVLFNMMANDDDDGPLSTALGSPYFLAIASGEGMLYAWHEYEACLERAGFADIERRSLPGDHGMVVATKR